MFNKIRVQLIVIATISLFHLSVFSVGLTAQDKFNLCLEANGNQCVTPFGQILGQFEGIKSYSNCRSECVYNEEYASQDFKNKVNSISNKGGWPWQCVEFARRFWIEKHGYKFDSVETAQDIFNEEFAINISNGKKNIPLHRYINGAWIDTSPKPKVEDLIIYSMQENNPNFQYGHVAVIVSVNDNYIEIAEQNFDNKIWQDPTKYSRRIKLENKNNRYYLQDEKNNPIIGWISFYDNEKLKIKKKVK